MARAAAALFGMVVVLFPVLCVGPAGADDGERAVNAAERTISAYLGETERPDGGLREQRVAVIIDRHFNVSRLARSAIGDAVWTSWQTETRDEFRAAYRRFLVSQTARNILRLKGAHWPVLGARAVADGTVAVMTRLSTRDGRERDLEWRMSDAARPLIVATIVDGIDVAHRQRAELLDVLNGPGGLPALLEGLRAGRILSGPAEVSR